ncbi:MAG: cobalamin biosynthesis protein [Leptolyngbya sp. DLM2.Bin15]|nr:MAG: cobalamin biosynthesis protein [Leptolyngbya sp. DLM2.Bin15]
MDLDAIALLGGAALLDYLIGDPWTWPHPVQAMGWVISVYSRGVLAWLKSPWALRLAGVGLTLWVILGSGAIAFGLVWLGDRLHPILGMIVAMILLASCLAGRSLRDAAFDVLTPLQQGDLEAARSRLGRYVGRDTDQLSEAEILRAVLETVTENAVDGVMAPLFYAILGALIHPMAAVALAMGYKAASTLDSMVGYRRAPYTDLGWCSARLEDILTWFPCRLTVLTLALWSRRPRQVLQVCRRDAIADPSPNSGWSECIYAAVLGVQVGGDNIYRGVVTSKPLLGDPVRPITPAVVRKAIALTRRCLFLWLGCGGLVLVLLR